MLRKKAGKLYFVAEAQVKTDIRDAQKKKKKIVEKVLTFGPQSGIIVKLSQTTGPERKAKTGYNETCSCLREAL